MIHLTLINNITDDLIQFFKLNKEDQIYEIFLNDNKIGYAIIRNNNDDKLYILIADEYQNMGYGSTIFELLLSKVAKPIKCIVPSENKKMNRILQKNNGIEIGRNQNIIHYLIK